MHSHLRQSFFLVVALVPPIAQSAERWVFKGAPEPLVRNVRILANEPVASQTTLFVATLGGGMVKLVDQITNITGQPVNSGLPSLRMRNVGGSAVAGTPMYVATEAHGVYKSTDDGASWQAANGSGGGALACRTTNNMSFRSATEVWVVTGCSYASGVHRTTDGGANWTRLGSATIPADANGTGLVFSGATTVAVTTANYGIYRSDDSGANWVAINNGLPEQGGAGRVHVFGAAFGTTAADMIASVNGAGVYRSTDSGANWSASNTGLPSTNPVAAISREGPSTFYVGIDGHGIYRSSNGGVTWSLWGTTNAEINLRHTRSVFYDPGSSRYYVATLRGLYRSSDGGSNFIKPDWMPNGPVNSLTVGQDNAGYLASATVAKLLDTTASQYDEASVMELSNGLVGTSYNGRVKLDHNVPGKAYATLDATGMYKTTDGGSSWSPVTSLPMGAAERVRFNLHPLFPYSIWAGLTNPFLTATGGGIYNSTDSGDNWLLRDSGLTDPRMRHVNHVNFHGGNPPTYLATAYGVHEFGFPSWVVRYSALDAGGARIPANWVEANPNSSFIYVAIEQTNADGSMTPSTGIVRGIVSSWTTVLPNRRARQVRVEGDGSIIALLHDDGGQPSVMRSRDGGDSWRPFNQGLPPGSARTAAQTGGQTGGLEYKVVLLSTDGGVFARVDPDTRDLNGDGFTDLLWANTSDGSVQAWIMYGFDVLSLAGLLPAGLGYTVTHVADLNADLRADLLIRHTDGTIILWLMRGRTVLNQTTLAPAGSGFSVLKTADFNGDGKADLLMQHTDGRVQAWMMDGANVTSVATFVGAGSGWTPAQVADYDGDGKSDIVWQHTGGSVQAWLMNGTTVSSVASLAPAGSGWSVVRTGDFNGDWKADLLWQHADGRTQAWLMNGLAVTGLASFTPAGTGWSPVLAGDIDGDGKDDIFWQHTSGASQTWLMNGLSVTALASFVAAGPWSATHLLDVNGDGRKDVFWRNANGSVQAWTLSGLSVIAIASLAPPGTYQLIP